MKLKGMEVSGGGGERAVPAFTLAGLTRVWIILSVFILLLAAAVIYQIANSAVNRAFQHRAETLASNLAIEVMADMQPAIVAVEASTFDPQVLSALKENDSVQLAAVELRLIRQFPRALRVRLVPVGGTVGVEGGLFPALSFADLEMLRSGEEDKAPPIEAHFFGMEIAHVDIVRPVHDGDGRIIGQVLASFGGGFVQEALNGLSAPLGYVVVSQVSDDKSGIKLATRGETELTGKDNAYSVAVPGTRWSVMYWPPSAEISAAFWQRAALWMVVVLAIALLVAVAYWLYRRLRQAYQADAQTIIDLAREIQTGRSFHQEHKLCIRDGEGMLEVMEAMAQSSSSPLRNSAMIPDADRPMSPRESADEVKQGMTKDVGGKIVTVPESIFRAYDIRGVVGKTLSEGIVYNIGRAIGSEAFVRGQQTIIVGRDGRLSGPNYASALINGLSATGRDVIDIGQVPTPLLYFATHYLNTGSGVMVTGSHNPADYNGFKMVLRGETLAEEDIQALRRRIERADFTNGSGSVRGQDVIADYIETIVGDVQLSRPLKAVVDCGNGVAGGVAPALLRNLGCEVIELFCEVDGRFPNHHPDPSQPENLEDLIGSVKKNKADLGMAFDGDGDRLALVDGNGKVIWPDRQMMLYARDVLSRNPGATILFDIKCSRHLAKYISKLGGQPLMWKTGHSLIKRKMKETGALLAGEMSGHIFFKERWFGFDDALYTAARLLEVLSKESRSVAEVFQALPDAVSTPELRVDLAEGEQTKFMTRLLELANLKGAALITIDGLRADFEDGWGLVRASNTTPSLILRFEANSDMALRRIKEEFRALMRKVDPAVQLPF